MKGLIFIPDITGFTHFVKNIDAELGAIIIQDLLTSIMNSNPLNMNVSEIEGDAILFYKIGEPHKLTELVKAFVEMQYAFKFKYDHYKTKYKLDADLSLKLIVHYGDIIVYDVMGFKKLYGEAIIEAHRLLKNGNTAQDYILVTEEYMKALKMNISEVLTNESSVQNHSHFLQKIKNVAYHLCPNEKKHLVFQT